jgi:hypothetical protein
MAWKNTAMLFAALALVAASPVVVMAAQAGKPAAKATTPGSPRPIKGAVPPGPLLFHGYACGGDCTSHQEGYSWASAHKIANPMDCRGTSETFIEGCRAYAGIEGPMGAREIFQDED